MQAKSFKSGQWCKVMGNASLPHRWELLQATVLLEVDRYWIFKDQTQ